MWMLGRFTDFSIERLTQIRSVTSLVTAVITVPVIYLGMYICVVIAYTEYQNMDGKVANPACGQLNKENEHCPVSVRAREFGLARRVRPSRPASACSFSIPRAESVCTSAPKKQANMKNNRLLYTDRRYFQHAYTKWVWEREGHINWSMVTCRDNTRSELP